MPRIQSTSCGTLLGREKGYSNVLWKRLIILNNSYPAKEFQSYGQIICNRMTDCLYYKKYDGWLIATRRWNVLVVATYDSCCGENYLLTSYERSYCHTFLAGYIAKLQTNLSLHLSVSSHLMYTTKIESYTHWNKQYL